VKDYERGFLQLLGQLTSVGNISREAWDARFNQMKETPNTYLVTVIEDTRLGKVKIAMGKVLEKQ
jgi:glucosamine-phosphate N-acetyltransferase